MDVVAWLRGLGLEQYAPAFRDNDVDGEVLPQLTSDDLISIGVTSVGHRRRLLAAIAALRDEPARVSNSGTHEQDPASSISSRTAADAERRQLTVMFCDLVSSTALAGRLDPEDLREVIANYHRAVAEIIAGFDGFVAKYMGDGVLVYFGYPQAHEDDAERAVRAGLAVIEAVGRLDVKSVQLQARVGIATGLVVVGDLIGEGSAQEQSVVGETPNLAARLQAVAEPDAVVIASGTRRLVGDLFEYRDLGAVEAKGITGLVPAWQVLRPSVIASRFEALRGSVLTRLVGRDEEMEVLLRRWAHAKAGNGRVMLISAEPGVGKSRLTQALAEQIAAEPHVRLQYFCSPHHQDNALYPVVAQMERAAGLAHEDTPAARCAKMRALLATAALPIEDVALIEELHALPSTEVVTPLDVTPQRKKQKMLEALLRWVEGLARRQPVLMLFDDIHWIDPSSRELLDRTIELVADWPVLLLAMFRPEFQPPWIGQPHVTMLALARLDRHDTTTMVANVAGNAVLPPEIVEEIAERTDGVPLFVEELTKAVLESGANVPAAVSTVPHPALSVPATLHASLMARLDRLGPAAKDVAQAGAAIGREFEFALLASSTDLPEPQLREALDRLTNAGLLFIRGTPPQSSYVFKHALVQDVAYGTLLRGRRQRLHAHIAATLEDRFPEIVAAQPALLAQHCANAGRAEQAVAYWRKAGQQALARSAMAEAAAQFQKGLAQLELLPENRERQRHELEIRSALCAVLQAIKGYAARETGDAYARARKLWEQLDAPSEFLEVLYGQSHYHSVRGEIDLALCLDEGLVRLSRQRNDAVGVFLGNLSLGRASLPAGRFGPSRLYVEEALALYEPISHLSRLQQDIVHPQVASKAYLGNALFCLGFPDEALSRSNAAIAEARRLAHLPSLAASLVYGARLHSLVGDNAGLDERADELVALTTERGFPHWGAQGTIYRGWVKVKTGDLAEGISLLRSGSTTYRATGAEAWMTYHNALLAAACEIAGQIEEALTLLDDALRLAERTGERWFVSELNRHKGELLLRQGHTEAAEELYRKALSVAAKQEAKQWELRAAASLARLRRNQERRVEARDLLVPIYNWFTEGFDTPDLKEAKALLDELT